jgi:DNA-binding protein HU-beta
MSKVTTKSQVVAHLAEKAGIQKKTSAAVLEELIALATKEVKHGGQFVIPGLGKAVKAHRKAREGRNPQTGEKIQIPAKTVVKFRLSKSFKDAVMLAGPHGPGGGRPHGSGAGPKGTGGGRPTR